MFWIFSLLSLMPNNNKIERFFLALRPFVNMTFIQVKKNDTKEASLSEEQDWLIMAYCYATFYVRNLRVFIKNHSVLHGRYLQSSLMFVGKPGAYPSRASFCCSTLG